MKNNNCEQHYNTVSSLNIRFENWKILIVVWNIIVHVQIKILFLCSVFDQLIPQICKSHAIPQQYVIRSFLNLVNFMLLQSLLRETQNIYLLKNIFMFKIFLDKPWLPSNEIKLKLQLHCHLCFHRIFF